MQVNWLAAPLFLHGIRDLYPLVFCPGAAGLSIGKRGQPASGSPPLSALRALHQRTGHAGDRVTVRLCSQWCGAPGITTRASPAIRLPCFHAATVPREICTALPDYPADPVERCHNRQALLVLLMALLEHKTTCSLTLVQARLSSNPQTAGRPSSHI